MTLVSITSMPAMRSTRQINPRSSVVTSLEEARSAPAGVSGRNEPTCFGANGSAMSTSRRPCANQANGMTVPRKR